MLAREQFGLHGDLRSDAGSVLRLTQSLLDLPGLHFMRDPTRGGLATVAHEICRATGLQVRLNDSAIPVRDQVRLGVPRSSATIPTTWPARAGW